MYKITENIDHIELTNLDHFLISQVFDCGQCFRFDENGGGIEGVALGKFVRLEQPAKDTVRIYGITRADFDLSWKSYLGLDDDYVEIEKDILTRRQGDTTMTEAVKKGCGIRILHQDKWEALCSFIISQNNNIPRIKKIIENMSRAFGERIDDTHYAFPTAEALMNAGVDEIFELKTGFRAKYIYDAAEKVATGKIDLSLVDSMTTEEAIEYLTQIKGVGLKVASCALLFGFNKSDAFPVDVWVKKVLAKYYPDGLDISSLGKYAGLVQQYLFYYERYQQ
ncbi:MAG: DNA-3-methyladenine glycosylase 2 [Clostridia bacterium]|nr:DNA-3-methyladenine glycosylase 2 [Clostridia bacterium]